MTDCVGVFEAKFTLQLIAPYSIVRTALAQVWQHKSFTHIEHGAGAVGREGLVN